MNIATHVCRCYPHWRGDGLVFECKCRDEDRSVTIARDSGITIRDLIARPRLGIPDDRVVIVHGATGGRRVAADAELDVIHTEATLPAVVVWAGSRCWVLDRSDCRWWRWYLHEVATSLAACLDPDGPEWPGATP